MNKKMALTVAVFGLMNFALIGCGGTSLDDWSLTADDWLAACESGDINSGGGCKGDISSDAMQKINLVGHDFLGNSGITGGGADTVWIRQIGTGTECIANDTHVQVMVDNNTTVWSCGVALPQAQLVGVEFEFLGGSYIGGTDQGDTATVANLTYIADGTDMNFGTYANFPSTATTSDVTAYVICVSRNVAGEASAFVETPRVALSSDGC